MATDLKTIETKTRKDLTSNTFEMVDSEVSLTAFWGGDARGRCLQLGVDGVKGFTGEYIHLNLENAIALRKQLDDFINYTY